MKQYNNDHHVLLLIFLLAVLSLLIGCGPNAEVVQVTTDYQIAQAVTATLAVVRQKTPYPTHTTYPTATPYATSTPYLTATPYSTATRYPSATPYPTFTPAPTITNTPTPTQSVYPTAPVIIPTTPPNVDVLVLQYLRQLSTQVGVVTGLIDTATNNQTGVDCQAFLLQHDQILVLPTLDVSSSVLAVQGAYGEYRASVEEFATITAGHSDSCRTLLASQSTASIPHTDWEWVRFQLTKLLLRIGTAIRLVGG